MILNVTLNNEHYFYPNTTAVDDKGNQVRNLDLKEKDRFTVIVQKVNEALVAGNWWEQTKDGAELKNLVRLRDYVKGLKNAPQICINGKETREMTIDDILSDKHPELFRIAFELDAFINNLERAKEEDEKK